MEQSTRGSLRLFQAAGIGVYFHWSWFLFGLWQITMKRGAEAEYTLQTWKAAEYVALFVIILMHEFGHALACRSVGGWADRILLTPLGGIAYVAPPPRPGAFLWSIVGGPLVNVVLVAPLYGLLLLSHAQEWDATLPDLAKFVTILNFGNLVLLVLNLVPIYPLDGGQILHALLWYSLGRWKSLRAVGAVGMFMGGILFLAGIFLFVFLGLISAGGEGAAGGMLAIIALFVCLRSFVAYQQASAGLALLDLPRHDTCACPSCAIAPPNGAFWLCEHCETRFDLFASRGRCPACGAWYLAPACVHCHKKAHIDRWFDPHSTAVVPPEPESETRETEVL